MATKIEDVVNKSKRSNALRTEENPKNLPPRCAAICPDGPKDARQFIAMFGALLADVRDGRIGANVANAMSSAGARMLKAAEMEYRYGVGAPGTRKVLELA